MGAFDPTCGLWSVRGVRGSFRGFRDERQKPNHFAHPSSRLSPDRSTSAGGTEKQSYRMSERLVGEVLEGLFLPCPEHSIRG